MSRKHLAFLLVTAGLGAAGYAIWPISSRKDLSAASPSTDFTLLDHLGRIHKLHAYAKKKSVILVGASLACSKDFFRLATAAHRAEASGSQVLFISSGAMEERKELLKLGGNQVPILLDPSGAVAKTFGLRNFEDAVELEPPAWKIKFRGSLAARLQLAELPECSLPQTTVKDLSFEKSVAPVIAKKCMNCHSANGRFPPQLDSFASLRRWSAMIRETLLTARMPPFSSDPLYGAYRNDISLTPQEKRLLVDWIDAGMPRENEVHVPLKNMPYKRQHPRRPLLHTAAMAKPFQVPTKGSITYKYFQLGGAAPFDMWVSAIHTESTNPRQLHHQSLMVVAKPLAYFEGLEAEWKSRFDETEIQEMDASIPAYIHGRLIQQGFTDRHYTRLQNWAAGKPQPVFLGKKTALFIPKGYYLILESHHMGTGREEEEKTKISFYGDREDNGLKPIHVMEILAPFFEIPPGEASYPVASKIYPVQEDMEIVSLLGHMHMRGRSVKLMVNEPDGVSRVLASIPDYYYGWQTGSGLVPLEGIPVRKGSALWVSCIFDNSAQNPNNPDPTMTVKRGQRVDRTEMCKMNVQFVRR